MYEVHIVANSWMICVVFKPMHCSSLSDYYFIHCIYM